MSTYDDASLVFYPSGYKTSVLFSEKPMDANGQLTFSRASNATRVASNGLIEEVRTNLLLQSNTFSTTWTNVGTSETSGQAGYDGTNNAWLLDIIGNPDSQRISQTISASGSLTFSVYLKAGTKNWALLRGVGTANASAYFNIQTGVVGATASGCTATIASAGNGYYRCSISFDTTVSDVRIYPATGDGNITQTSGNIYIQNAQLEAGDIATQYIATTTSARSTFAGITVDGTSVPNVPRIDYTGGGCGKLLLEPQRTNLALWSENFDNAGWTKAGSTITANNATSPDGYTSADRLVETATTATHLVLQSVTLTAAAHTFSCFIKAVSGSTRNVGILFNLTGKGVLVNPSTGAVVVYVGTTASDVKIETYPNGWYRVSVTATTAAITESIRIYLGNGTTWTAPYAGDGTSSALIWGAQVELGSYATSYIPTLSTSVTRVADAAIKTGISSLIGQTEGTFFAEVDFTDTNADQMYLTLSDGTTSNRIHIGFDNGANYFYCNIRSGNIAQGLITSPPATSGVKKIAVGYKLNDYVLYINGVQIGVDASALVPACSRVDVGGYLTAGFEYPVSQALLFKTRLDNATLQSLTTL